MRKYLKNRTVQDSIVVFTLGLVLFVFSVYSFFNAKVKQTWVMSPYLFPMLIAVFAIGLGYCMFMDGKHQMEREEKTGVAEDKFLPIDSKKVVMVVAISILYYIIITFIGFIPATAIFLATLMWFMGERRLKIVVPVAIITPLVLYVLFAMGLNVRLP